ncbi:hypothetical protein AMTRI_Chr06g178220 [Amborella trichopoda]
MFLIFLLLFSLLVGKPSAIAGKPFTIYRRVLHQPFYPTNSGAPAPPLSPPPPPENQIPVNGEPFFPTLAPPTSNPTSKPAPTTSSVTIPANISGLIRPNTPESHPRIAAKITVAVVVILATLAVVFLLAYYIRKSRRNSGNGVSLKGSRSSRSGSLRLFPAANSGTKVGVSTSSDVLYLGTVNAVSPCQKNVDSPENRPEYRYSPEIRPLPPLSRPVSGENVAFPSNNVAFPSNNGAFSGENVAFSGEPLTESGESEDEFYSPGGSPNTSSAGSNGQKNVPVSLPSKGFSLSSNTSTPSYPSSNLTSATHSRSNSPSPKQSGELRGNSMRESGEEDNENLIFRPPPPPFPGTHSPESDRKASFRPSPRTNLPGNAGKSGNETEVSGNLEKLFNEPNKESEDRSEFSGKLYEFSSKSTKVSAPYSDFESPPSRSLGDRDRVAEKFSGQRDELFGKVNEFSGDPIKVSDSLSGFESPPLRSLGDKVRDPTKVSDPPSGFESPPLRSLGDKVKVPEGISGQKNEFSGKLCEFSSNSTNTFDPPSGFESPPLRTIGEKVIAEGFSGQTDELSSKPAQISGQNSGKQPARAPPPPPPPPPPFPSRFWEPSLLTPLPRPMSRPQSLVTPESNGETPSSFLEGDAGISENSGEKSDDNPRPKLKPLHWDKVRASSDRATVWDRLKSSSFKLNEEMIETLFVCNNANSVQKDTNRRLVLPSPNQENRILDPKKSQNIAILLRALNVTKDEVCEALLECNTDSISSELLETLLKMAPTKEEEVRLKKQADISKLGPAERFLSALLDVPLAFKRVEVMLYMANFEVEISYLRKSFESLEVACEELRSSRLFLKLLEAVLKTGNRMNVGTNRGDARAFKLDTLLKLVDIKGTDGKTTLLHFVVQEMIRTEASRLPDHEDPAGFRLTENQIPTNDAGFRQLGLRVVAGLGGELENVKKAASMDSEGLSNCVIKLARGLEDFNGILNLLEKEGGGFFKVGSEFSKRAEAEIIRVRAEESVALSLVKEITEYFHGDAEREEAHPFRIFVIVRDFLSVLDRVCKDVGRLHDRTVVSAGRNFPVPVNPMALNVFPGFRARRLESSDDDSGSSSP